MRGGGSGGVAARGVFERGGDGGLRELPPCRGLLLMPTMLASPSCGSCTREVIGATFRRRGDALSIALPDGGHAAADAVDAAGSRMYM